MPPSQLSRADQCGHAPNGERAVRLLRLGAGSFLAVSGSTMVTRCATILYARAFEGSLTCSSTALPHRSHLRRVSHHSSAPWGWGMTLRWASDSLARPLIVASVFARNPRPTLVVVAGEDAADRMAVALSAYLGRDVVERYPERKDLPWSDKAPDGAVIGARCHAVARLAAGEECVVVASARALVRCVPPAGSRYFEPITYELATADPLRRRACPAAVSRLHERRRGRRARHLPRAWATPSTSFRPRRAPPCALSSSATRSTRSAAWCRRPARHRRPGARHALSLSGTGAERGGSEALPAAHVSGRPGRRGRRRPHGDARARGGVSRARLLSAAPVSLGGIPACACQRGPLMVVAEPRSLFDDATRAYDEVSPGGVGEAQERRGPLPACRQARLRRPAAAHPGCPAARRGRRDGRDARPAA